MTHADTRRAVHSVRFVLIGAIAIATAMPQLRAQTAGNVVSPAESDWPKSSKFDISTIKPSRASDGTWTARFTPYGYTARGVPLRKLIQDAFGVYEEDRLVGGPSWINTTDFDVEAIIDNSGSEVSGAPTLDELRHMLQGLLTERFKLQVHTEDRAIRDYALVIAKDGPRLRVSDPDSYGGSSSAGLVARSSRGILEVQHFTIKGLANLLSLSLNRIVVDQTNLTGRYDFFLRWNPDDATPPSLGADNGRQISPSVVENSAPSIFTALNEQLGLRLLPSKVPVEVIVVDSAMAPNEN